METLPNLQVYELGHLGLVTSVLDRIRLVQTCGSPGGLQTRGKGRHRDGPQDCHPQGVLLTRKKERPRGVGVAAAT
jgi:hypothetical protein